MMLRNSGWVVAASIERMASSTAVMPSKVELRAPIGTEFSGGNVWSEAHWRARFTPPTEAVLRLKVKTRSPAPLRVELGGRAVELEPDAAGFGSPPCTCMKAFLVPSSNGASVLQKSQPRHAGICHGRSWSFLSRTTMEQGFGLAFDRRIFTRMSA